MSGGVLQPRQWRPRRAVRIAGVAIALVGIGLAALEMSLRPVGQAPVLVTVLTVLFGALFACVGFGYAQRYRVALGDGVLTLTGIFRTRRIPVEYVMRARFGKYGMIFDLHDARRVVFRGLEISVFESWLRDDAQSFQVVNDVLAAAEQAREAHPLAPVATDAVRRNMSRRRNTAWARLAAIIVLSAAVFYYDYSNHTANSSQSTAKPTLITVTVGECMQDPSTSFDMKSTPCTSAHTAQVYSVTENTTTSSDSCSKSPITNKLLPQNHYVESVTSVFGDTPTTICLIITPSITHSVVQGH